MAKRRRRRRTSARKTALANRQVAREYQTFEKLTRTVPVRRSVFNRLTSVYITPKKNKRWVPSTTFLTRTGPSDTRKGVIKNIWKPYPVNKRQLKICLQRQRRREILFANAAGKGIQVKHKKRYTINSFVRC